MEINAFGNNTIRRLLVGIVGDPAFVVSIKDKHGYIYLCQIKALDNYDIVYASLPQNGNGELRFRFSDIQRINITQMTRSEQDALEKESQETHGI